MPTFTRTQRHPFARQVLFDFLRRPANIVALAPPGVTLTLVEGPDVIQQGSRMVLGARRFGLRTTMVLEVIELSEPAVIVEEQREGLFRSWRHEQRFTRVEDQETEVEVRIDFEPPGGILGLTLTARAILDDLEKAHVWRRDRLLQLLGAAAS